MSPIKIPHDSETYSCFAEMVSVPCFIYDLKQDKYPCISRILRQYLGIDGYEEGFCVFLERIHPSDRLRVIGQYSDQMPMILRHRKLNAALKLEHFEFSILNREDRWVHCDLKLDVMSYDHAHVPDKLFGVFTFNVVDTAQLHKLSTPGIDTLCGENLTVYFKELRSKMFKSTTRTCRESKNITQRESEIINLIAQGLCTKEIASHLGISFHTVETHRKNLFSKFNSHSAPELLHRLMTNGLWPPP